MSGYAWVTLATNDSYSLGALVLAHSLKKSNTAHKLAVLITPAVSQPMREQLQTVFDVVKTVDVLDSKDEAHLALMKRPELGITFTKIHCWRLTEFEKCVFLDADTLVVRNCDELFQREEFSAAPDVSWPDCFNSGVFVYKPSVETFNKLLQFAVEKGSFDGGDQGLLNQFFSDWATEDIKKHLPFVYNLTSVAAYSYIPAFKQYGAQTRIVHFIGTGKPWLQQLDPATRTITPTTGSEHLAPLLQQWWDLFCEKVHPNLSKNLENNNDGMSHPPVEVCSNTSVALTSDEPQSPCLIEPCLQYREQDDYRQHNLPYQPFVVRGSSGELLNVEYLMVSAVPPDESGEQLTRDEVEEKDAEPTEQEETKAVEQTSPETLDEKTEEVEKEPSFPKDPFDYNTFFPDEKCVSNYLEQNVVTYQPFEMRQEDKQPVLNESVPLPRFLTMPEDDQRQMGNFENVEYQRAPEPPPPPTPTATPVPAVSRISPVPPTTSKKSTEAQKQSTSPPAEKHELSKSKSMTFIPDDIITDSPSPPRRSIWTSQPNVNVDSNRKYSMPKLKPILPRQNSKIIQTSAPRITLYTEILMSADYKDPDNLPKDKIGFVEKELRRSKSEADLKGKFGPLPHAKSPEIEMPEPKKSPFHNLHNDVYDLSRCKRQLGNKPRDRGKENVKSKLNTSWKDKKSVIKKRKSKELSPNDGGKEKPQKKERKDRQKRNENVEEILKRLWEFSKNYQHYFGVNPQGRTTERSLQSEFKQFRNFVNDQKETTQKGLLGIKDIMKEPVVSDKKCVRESEIVKVNGLHKQKSGEVIIEKRDKIQRNRNASVENTGIITQITDLCEVDMKEKSVEVKPTCTKNDTPITLETVAIIPTENGTTENLKTSTKSNEGTTLNDFDQNESSSIRQHSTKSTIGEKIRKNCHGTSEKPNNEYFNFLKASKESSIKLIIPEEKSQKNGKLGAATTKPAEDDFTNTAKQPEDHLYTLISQTDGTKSSKVTEETTTRRINGENDKQLKHIKDKDEIKTELLKEVEYIKEVVSLRSNVLNITQNGGNKNNQKTEDLRELVGASQSDVLENTSSSTQNEKDKNDEVYTAVQLNDVQSGIKDTTPSESQVTEVDSNQSDTQEPPAAEVSLRAATETQHETATVQKKVSDITTLRAPVERTISKGIFTIGSPEGNTQVNVKDGSHPNGDVRNVSLKPVEEVPLRKTLAGKIYKPDEILCVPDFDTPRSSRTLVSISKPDTDSIPQAPPSTPVATPRKARIQRKPYENGSKCKSPGGKKTPDNKHSAGIAGAIAQLNLEGSGQAMNSEATSAAHQEYIRRQNWETGNMDYMGKDSFDNIWSKICQTLEGKELDQATESIPVAISIEEKTKLEGGIGTEAPVSLSTILQKCPEFIDTLPSETVTGPVEEDEIIFSKLENRQKCLTNIKEEEENNGVIELENVKLSDILKPHVEKTAPSGNVVPKESVIIATAESDEKPQPVCTSTFATSQTTATDKLESDGVMGTKELSITAGDQNPQLSSISTSRIVDVQTNKSPVTDQGKQHEQTKPEVPVLEISTTQSYKPIKPEIAIQPPTPECTTVAIRQPICLSGVPSEDKISKIPNQKIAEKKRQLQQLPETPTEPIPLPAPEPPNDCKTMAIVYPSIASAQIDEKEETMKIGKEEKQKKGVFSKLLEMVGVVPKCEDASKSVFYDIGEVPPKQEEGVDITVPKTDVQKANKKPDTEKTPSRARDLNESKEHMLAVEKVEEGTEAITKITDEISAENKQEMKNSAKPLQDDTNRDQVKAGQAPMSKPARNSSPKSFPPKAPGSIIIPQMPPRTTASPPPEPPKRRNSALLKVEETIPDTPPVPEPQKKTDEPIKTEVENIIEKAKTEVENLLQDRRSAEKEANETTDLINTMKLMIGVEAPQPAEVEELKVTTEEERQRHKGEVVSSKLSDQILKAIPPPRRKAISESKSEASCSSGAIPKMPTPSSEKPKNKPSSIPVPPPRSKGKPTTPAPSKGKTKK